jgi:hypothetical protein
MSLFLSNRDGGLTDEQGHYRFQTNVWNGHVIGNGLQVTQNSPLGMSVIVGEGDARVPYAGYAYTAWNDANEVVTISTANPSNPRIDRLVMYVDRGETPQQVNPNNPDIPKFAVVAGTPGAVPTRPSNAAVNSAVGATNPWIDLADIRVNAGATQITNTNITDRRVQVKLGNDVVRSWSGTMNTSGTLSTSIYVAASISMPQSATGKLFVTGNFEINNAGGGSGIYLPRIRRNTTAANTIAQYVSSGWYQSSISVSAIIDVSGGETIDFAVARDAGSGGTLISRSHYTAILL